MHIEEPLRDSKLCHNLRFDKQFGNTEDWIKFRIANAKITTVLWFTLSPIYCTYSDTLYNPRCHAMIILN